MRARALFALLSVAACAMPGCLGPASNQPPTAHATVSTSSAAVGDEVIFTGTAFDPDGSIVRFEWDFESDGVVDFTNATRGAAVHVFARPGNFTATFTATDDKGATATATVSVLVIARFLVTADWGSDEGYLIHAPPGLDASLVEVRASPGGAPAPFDFRVGTGLASVNNTTFRISLPLTFLGRYGVTDVEARYNGTLGGERSFRAVPYMAAENDTAVTFDAVIHDLRAFPGSNATFDYTGKLGLTVPGKGAVETFRGAGSSLLLSSEGGTNTTAAYTFSHVGWNSSVGRDNGTYAMVTFDWLATGALEQVTSSGFTTTLGLASYEGRRFRGNLTFEEAAGAGNFSGPLPGTGGTASYALGANETLTIPDGNGLPRLALRVLENLSLNGTIGGAPYTDMNLSERWVAASDEFLHPDIVTSWNDTARVGTTNLSDSGARYLDSDGDGVFNPDLRPAVASDGQAFYGLAPADLASGDAFTVRNLLGASARLEVQTPRTEILVATGFVAGAVLAATVEGAVEGAGFSGILSADVVATGVHGGLRLSERTELALGGSTYSRHLSLASNGA